MYVIAIKINSNFTNFKHILVAGDILVKGVLFYVCKNGIIAIISFIKL
jgi:hypothetical protein